MANPPKRRVLLIIVPNRAQRGAPDANKRLQIGRHLIRTNETDAPDRNSRVLEQSLGRVGPIYDVDERLEQQRYVLAHLGAELYRDLTDRPDGIVAHGYVLRVQVQAQDLHEIVQHGLDVLEAGFG